MVPSATDPRWKMLVMGQHTIQPQFLAMRLLMQRIDLKMRRDKSPAMVQRLASDLHQFCVKYEKFLGPDLAQINR